MKCWCGGQTARRTFSDPRSISSKMVCLDSDFHDPTATGRPVKVKTIYVAGPMSGYADNNYPAFNQAAEQLREAGFKAVNPAEFGSTGGHYVDLIREDLRQMLDCHAVAVLDNWWESTGARNEVQVAGLLMMPVRTVREWITYGNQ